MRRLVLTTIALTSGLIFADVGHAQTTNVAYATGEVSTKHLVFLEAGNRLPQSALPLVWQAEAAAKGGKTVRVAGAGAGIVRQAMIRDGVADASVIIVPAKASSRAIASGESPTLYERMVQIEY